jgi:predicted DNA-binding protein
MKLTTLKMPPEMIERLAAVTERTGAPRAVIIRRAIDKHLREIEGTDGEDNRASSARRVAAAD